MLKYSYSFITFVFVLNIFITATLPKLVLNSLFLYNRYGEIDVTFDRNRLLDKFKKEPYYNETIVYASTKFKVTTLINKAERKLAFFGDSVLKVE